jgi:hypothetical protein
MMLGLAILGVLPKAELPTIRCVLGATPERAKGPSLPPLKATSYKTTLANTETFAHFP